MPEGEWLKLGNITDAAGTVIGSVEIPEIREEADLNNSKRSVEDFKKAMGAIILSLRIQKKEIPEWMLFLSGKSENIDNAPYPFLASAISYIEEFRKHFGDITQVEFARLLKLTTYDVIRNRSI